MYIGQTLPILMCRKQNQGIDLIAFTRVGEGTVLVLLFWLFGLIQLQDVCSMCSPEPIILTYRGGQC